MLCNAELCMILNVKSSYYTDTTSFKDNERYNSSLYKHSEGQLATAPYQQHDPSLVDFIPDSLQIVYRFRFYCTRRPSQPLLYRCPNRSLLSMTVQFKVSFLPSLQLLRFGVFKCRQQNVRQHN
jgi:hypothetical protein